VSKLRKTCHTYGNYGKGKVYMRRIVLLALALVLLVGVGTGSADPVTIVSLTQHVVTDASLVLPVQHTHDEQQGSGNIVASSMLSSAGASASSLATLISGVSSDGRVFSGTATASASTQGTALVTARANGFSAFVVGFALTAPQQFTFEGDFTGNGQGSVWQAILFASPATPNTRMLFSFLGLDTRSIMESICVRCRGGREPGWHRNIVRVENEYVHVQPVECPVAFANTRTGDPADARHGPRRRADSPVQDQLVQPG